MAKAAIKIAHFLLSIICGVLVGYSIYYFRKNHDPIEATVSGIIVTIVAMVLLPKLHQGGGGGGEF